MSRDHRRLRVFQIAHRLATTIYKETSHFPRDEWYGLRAQLRRAAVSVATNVVEGNARHSAFEYVNCLNIARGSAAEAAYLVLLGCELGYFPVAVVETLRSGYAELIPQLEALVQKMRTLAKEDEKRRSQSTKD